MINTQARVTAAVPDSAYGGAQTFAHNDHVNGPEELAAVPSPTRQFAVFASGSFEVLQPMGQVTAWAEVRSQCEVVIAYRVGRDSTQAALNVMLEDRDRLHYELTRADQMSAGLHRRSVTGSTIDYAPDGGVALMRLALTLDYRPSF